jgi:hypothetical protein
MKSTPSSEKPYKCEYCGNGYMREKTLVAHLCEKKRRWLQKDEKRVRYGLYAFQRFYKLSAGNKKEKTYEDFVNSSYYNAFVKFGSFINNVKPLYPEKYIDYVVTSGVKLDHWAKDSLYEKYVLEFILKEDVHTALERSIQSMVAWSEDKSAPWNHYFYHVSTNRAVWDIKDGKVSPWLILNDEQLEMVYHVINPEHWAMRFKRLPNDVQLVKDVAKESNL